jgi:hypothetical protein
MFVIVFHLFGKVSHQIGQLFRKQNYICPNFVLFVLGPSRKISLLFFFFLFYA